MKTALFILVSLVIYQPLWAGCDHDRGDGKTCNHKAQEHFDKMDTNKDKVILEDEFQKAHAKKFAAMNTDGKPGVTIEEMKAFHKATRGHKEKKMGHGNHHKKDGKKHSH